jgi:hypothetical protein
MRWASTKAWCVSRRGKRLLGADRHRRFAGAEAEAAFAAADKASEGKIVIDWTRAGP